MLVTLGVKKSVEKWEENRGITNLAMRSHTPRRFQLAVLPVIASKSKSYGGINLSDEHQTITVKVDGAGMPLAAQYQDASMMHLNGLTSIIRRITPITPENVPALYQLLK
jgi:hypothetical protein